jgi:hypothetical protein
LFWTLGVGAARRVVESNEQHIRLVEVSEETV